MSAPRRALTLVALLLFTSLAMPTTTAQPSLLPGIEVTCNNSETAANLDVAQTSMLTVSCTVENPTVYSEDVEIEYDGNGLVATGLESRTIAGGEDVQFDVVITAPSGSDTAPNEFNITVTATVTSVQSIDWPDFTAAFAPSDESNIIVAVQPYSAVDIEVSPSYLKLEAGGMPGSVSVIVRNMGNAADTYAIAIADADLINKGFNVSVTPETNEAPIGSSAAFTVTLTPPAELDTEVIQVDLTITSTLRQMSSPEIFNINATAAPNSILDLSAMNIPSWAYIAAAVLAGLVVLAVVVSIGKKMKGKAGRYLDEYDGISIDDSEGEDEMDDEIGDEDDELDDIDLDELDDLDDLDL